MKVLYDISWLGTGFYHPPCRTGIFRVVENLAYGLKNSQECDLIFCTHGISLRLCEVLGYLESNPELAKVPLSYNSKNVKFRRSFYKVYQELNQKLTDIPASQKLTPEILRLRALRKVLTYVAQSVEFFYQPITPNSLAEAEIYHSPYEAIPDEIRKAATPIKKFSQYTI